VAPRYRPGVVAIDGPSLYLGQFTDDNAEKVGEALDAAGIDWWSKASGRLMRTISMQDWGVRLFVAEDRLDEARDLVRTVAPGALR